MTYLLIALGLGFVAMLIEKVWAKSNDPSVGVLEEAENIVVVVGLIRIAIVLGVVFYILRTGC